MSIDDRGNFSQKVQIVEDFECDRLKKANIALRSVSQHPLKSRSKLFCNSYEGGSFFAGLLI
jgi:hypothetical protein